MKKQSHLVTLVTASLLAALCCVATFIKLAITPTNGYVNLGDVVILLAACLLSPVYAALAAGIGSMLADILMGYAQYAPATFVIKALMGLIACLIFTATSKICATKKWLSPIFTILAGLCAEVIMVGGYFVYEAFILSYGMGAVASVIPNVFQGIAGILGSTILCEIISRTKIKNKLKS